MTEEKPAVPETFEQHELYTEAMGHLAEGQEAAAVEPLRQLAEVYPNAEPLRDLLLRTELKAATGSPGDVPVEHRAPTPVLRNLLLILLITTAALAMVGGLLAADKNLVEPTREARQRETRIATLRREIQERLDASDWSGAEELLDLLAPLVPGDEWIEEARQYLEEHRALDERYVEAVAAQDAGDRQRALALLRSIEAHTPGYRDVGQRIEELETLEALEATWLEAERRVEAEGWAAALDLLVQIRDQDPDYRKAQVKQRLHEIYERLADQEINGAGGDLERLRRGLEYLQLALEEEPTNRTLIDKQKLAVDYVKGAEALARQDWVTTVEHWDKVYAVQSDYQGGLLGARLRELYPRAASQLISEAGGAPEPLHQALDYLNRALDNRPDDEVLLAERRLVVEFLAGAEAAAQSYWDIAIAHWGPIYAERPDYQDGALRERLIEACANSDDPDPALCIP
jgi:hypothetical protein